jgi:hypothetical protein
VYVRYQGPRRARIFCAKEGPGTRSRGSVLPDPPGKQGLRKQERCTAMALLLDPVTNMGFLAEGKEVERSKDRLLGAGSV